MNRTFKVVFNRARACLMVANEITSSVQKKGTKTVIASALAAVILGAGFGAQAANYTDEQILTAGKTYDGDTFSNQARIFSTKKITVTLKNTTHNGIELSNNGAAIRLEYAESSVVVTGSTFSNNTINKDGTFNGGGGAIYISGTLTSTSTDFTSNTAAGNAGAIYYSGAGTITEGTFKTNKAGEDGGAIYANDNVTEINAATFIGNTAGKSGGAIYSNSATLKINAGTVFGDGTVGNANTANAGGAIYTRRVNVTGSVTDTADSRVRFNKNIAKTAGGAIYVADDAFYPTIKYAIFENNEAQTEGGGAIYIGQRSSTTIENSTFTGNTATTSGGAIHSLSSLTVTNTRFNTSQAATGGALYLEKGTTKIKSSTFEENSVTGAGGAIYVAAGTPSLTGTNTFTTNSAATGGAIYAANGTLTIGNSEETSKTTFKSNEASTAGGAIYIDKGTHSITNAAFGGTGTNESNTAKNGGAIYVAGVATTTISGASTSDSVTFTANKATAGAGGAIYATGGSTTNLKNVTFTSNTATTYGGALNIEGTATNLDVDAVKFASNTASTAGGAVALSALTEDQTQTGTISFTDVTFEGNNSATAGALYLGAKRIASIDGRSAFTGNKATTSHGGAIAMDADSSLTISGTTSFTGNTASSKYGGAIYSKGTLNVTGASFGGTGSNESNTASSGGAINAGENSELTIGDSTFTANKATSSGGAIYSGANSLTLNSSEFKGNSATYNGGALYAAVGSIALSSVTFGGTGEDEGNTAEKSGGAIYLYSSKDNTITDSSFIGNTATAGSGGAIAFGDKTTKLTITGTNTFIGNSTKGSSQSGGAIYNQGTLTVGSETDEGVTTFKSNSAKGYGGAIYSTFNSSGNSKVNLAVYHAVFGGSETGDGNSAASGGAIATRLYSVSSVSDSTFTANEATNYGGAIYAAGTSFDVNDSIFSGNTAFYGGAIYQISGTLTINAGSTFGGDSETDGNKASGYAGAIYLYSGTLNIIGTAASNVFFKNNTATVSGGAILLSESPPTSSVSISNATFTSNTAGNASKNYASGLGGALYLTKTSAEETTDTSPFSNLTFTSNKASKAGAIYVGENRNLSIGSTNTFTSNASTGTTTDMGGGAIFLDENATLTLGDTSNVLSFTDNTAERYGGAIYSKGSLTVKNTTFSTSQAKLGGAIYTNGTLNIKGTETQSVVFDNNKATSSGGAIYVANAAVATIENSKFTSNSGTFGGAVHIDGTLKVLGKNTFTSNESTSQGGGALYLFPADSTQLVVGESGKSTYSTFTNNSSKTLGGAIFIAGGTGTINSGHFEGNEAGQSGGAIALGPSLKTATSIVGSGTNKLLFSKNVANGTGSYGGGAIYVSSSAGTKTIGYATFTENTAAVNGGAILLSSSTPTSLVTISNSSFSDNTAGTASSNYTDGFGGAIYLRAISDEETIDSAPYTSLTFTSNKAGTAGALYVGAKRNLSIGSTNAFTSNVSTGTAAGTGGGAIFLAENATLTLGDTTGSLKFESNTASYAGGALYTQGTLNIANTAFTKNTATASGGALNVAGGTTSISGTSTSNLVTFTGNSAATGGAIYSSATLNLENTSFCGTTTDDPNSAVNGGAIYVANGTTALTGTNTFTGNKATATSGEASGGAVYVNDGTFTTEGTNSFTSNIAVTSGGAIYTSLSNSKATLTGTNTFTGNSAATGGAIYAADGALTIGKSGETSKTTFKSNTATTSGGAIYIDKGTHSITNADFGGTSEGNNAANGGAIYVAGAATTTITGASTNDTVTFTANKATAGAGGAIYASGGSTTNLKNATFTSNTATTYGGALNIEDSATSLDVDAVTFTSNKATFVGGAVALSSLSKVQKGSITFTDVTFEKNESASAGALSLGTKRVASIDGTSAFTGNKASSSHGGAIAMDADSSLTISGTTSFTGNTASSGYYGGAIYSAGTLDVTGASFGGTKTGEANTASYGGAVYASTDSKLTLKNSKFTANVASNSGGAIFLKSAKDNTITDSSFVGNTATTGHGGAIYLEGTLKVTGANFGDSVTVNANRATYGGAVYADVGSKLTLENSTFTANVASNSGGAIYLNSANENSIASSSFTGNTATYGGAIYLAAGSSTANRSVTLTGKNTFTKNSSSVGSGGALYVGSYVTVNGSSEAKTVFTGNTSNSNGGAIYAYQSSKVNLKNAYFNDNVADTSNETKGGALYLGSSASATISATETYAITGNKASLGGFAYLGESASLTLEATEGKVLTVGKEENVATETDSIASDNTFTSTLALQGEGNVVILGKTSDFSGNVNVGTDSNKTTAEIAGTFSSEIRRITLGEEAKLTINGDQKLSSNRDSDSATTFTLGNKAEASLKSLTLVAADAANVYTDESGKNTATKKAIATVSLGEKANLTIGNTLTVDDCASLAITGGGSTTEAAAKVTLQKLVTGNGSTISFGSETSQKVRVAVEEFAVDSLSSVKVKNGATLATTSNQIDAMSPGVATRFEDDAWLEFTDSGTVEESTFETLLKNSDSTNAKVQNLRFENGVLEASDGDKNLQGDVNLHIGQIKGFNKATVQANRELILGKTGTTSDVVEINTDATGARLNVRAGKLITKTKSVFTKVTDTDAFATELAKKSNVTIGDSSATGSTVSFDFIDKGTATLSAYTAMQKATTEGGVGTTDISLSNAMLAADTSGTTLEVKNDRLTLGAASGFEKITVGANVTFNLGNKDLKLASAVDDFDLTATNAKLNLTGGTLTTKVNALFTVSSDSAPFTGVTKKGAVTVADSNEVINLTDKGTATLSEYEALRTALGSGEKLLNVNLIHAIVTADPTTTSFTTDANLTFGALTGFETVKVGDTTTLTLAGVYESGKTVESHVENITLGDGSKLSLTGGRLATMSASLFENELSEGTEFVANQNKKGNVLIANNTVAIDLLDLGVCDITVYDEIKGKLITDDGSAFANLSMSKATLMANDSTRNFTVNEKQSLSFGAMVGFETVTLKDGGELNLGSLESSANTVALEDVSKLNLLGGTIHTTRASLLAGDSFADAAEKSGINIQSADVNVDFTDADATVSKTEYLNKVRGSLKVSGTGEKLKGVSLSRSTLAADNSDDGKSFTTDANLTFGAMAGFNKVTVSEGNTLHLGYAGLTSAVDNFEFATTSAKLYLDGGTLNTKVGALFTSSDSASGTDGVFTNLTKKAVTVTDANLVLNLTDTGTCELADYNQIRTKLGVAAEESTTTNLSNVNLINATLKADTTKTFTTEANLTFGAMTGFDKVTVSDGKTLSLGKNNSEATPFASKVNDFDLSNGNLKLEGGTIETRIAALFKDGASNALKKVTVTNSDVVVNFTDETTTKLSDYEAMRKSLDNANDTASDHLVNVNMKLATLEADGEKDFTADGNLTFGAMTEFTTVTVGPNKTLTLGNKDLKDFSSIDTITLSSDLASSTGKLHLVGGKLQTKVQSILTGFDSGFEATSVALKDAVKIDNDSTTNLVAFDFTDEATATLDTYKAIRTAVKTKDVSLSKGILKAGTNSTDKAFDIDYDLAFGAMQGFESATVEAGKTLTLGKANTTSSIEEINLGAGSKLNLTAGKLETKTNSLFTGADTDAYATDLALKEGVTISNSTGAENVSFDFIDAGTSEFAAYENITSKVKTSDVSLSKANLKKSDDGTFTINYNLSFGALGGDTATNASEAFTTVSVAAGKTLTLNGIDNVTSNINLITLDEGSALKINGGSLATTSASLFGNSLVGGDKSYRTGTKDARVTLTDTDATSIDLIDEGTATHTVYVNLVTALSNPDEKLKNLSLSKATLKGDSATDTFTVESGQNLSFGAMTNFANVKVSAKSELHLLGTTDNALANLDSFTFANESDAKLFIENGTYKTQASTFLNPASEGAADTFMSDKRANVYLGSDVDLTLTDTGSITHANYDDLRAKLTGADVVDSGKTPLKSLSLSRATLTGNLATDSFDTSSAGADLTFGAMKDFAKVTVAEGKTLNLGHADGITLGLVSKVDDFNLTAENSKLNLIGGTLNTNVAALYTRSTAGDSPFAEVTKKTGVTVTNSDQVINFLDTGTATLTEYEALRKSLKVGSEDHLKNVNLLHATVNAESTTNFTSDANLTFGALSGFESLTVAAGNTVTIGNGTDALTSSIDSITLNEAEDSLAAGALVINGGKLTTAGASLFSSAVTNNDKNYVASTKKTGLTLKNASVMSIDLTDVGTCDIGVYTDLRNALSEVDGTATTPVKNLSLPNATLVGNETTNTFTLEAGQTLIFDAVKDFSEVKIGNGAKLYLLGEKSGDTLSKLDSFKFTDTTSELHLEKGKYQTSVASFVNGTTFDASKRDNVFLGSSVDLTLTDKGTITHAKYNELKARLTGNDAEGHKNDSLTKLSLINAVLEADDATDGGRTFSPTENLTFGAMTGFEKVTVSDGKTLTLSGATDSEGKTVTSSITNITYDNAGTLKLDGASLKTNSTSLFNKAVVANGNFTADDVTKLTSVLITDNTTAIDLLDAGVCDFETYEALKRALTTENHSAFTDLSLSNALLKGDTSTSVLTVGANRSLTFGALQDFKEINVAEGGKLNLAGLNESSVIEGTIANVGALNLNGGRIKAARKTLLNGTSFEDSTALRDNIHVKSKEVSIDFTDTDFNGVSTTLYNQVRKSLGTAIEDWDETTDGTTKVLKNVSLLKTALVGTNEAGGAKESFTTDADVTFGAMQNFGTVNVNDHELHIGNKDESLESTVDSFEFTGDTAKLVFEGGSLKTNVSALFNAENGLKGSVTVANASFVLNLTDTERRTLTEYEQLRTALSNDSFNFRNVNMENATIDADTTKTFDADADLTFGAMTDFNKVTVSGDKTLSLGRNNSATTPFTSTIKDFDLSNGNLKLEGGSIETTIAALFKDGASNALKNVTVTNSDVVVNFTDEGTTKLSDYEAMRKKLDNADDASDHLVNVNMKLATLEADGDENFTSDGNLSFGAMTGFNEVTVKDGKTLTIGKTGANSDIKTITLGTDSHLTVAAGELATGRDQLVNNATGTYEKKTGISLDSSATIDINDGIETTYAEYEKLQTALGQSAATPLTGLSLSKSLLKGDGTSAASNDFVTGNNLKLSFGAIQDLNSLKIGDGTKVYVAGQVLGSEGALLDATSSLKNVSFGNDASQLHLLNGKVVTTAKTFLANDTFDAESNGHVYLGNAVDVTLTNEGVIEHATYNALKKKLTSTSEGEQPLTKLSLNKAVLKADSTETGGTTFTANADLTFGAMTGFETVTVGTETANQTLTLNGAKVDGKKVASQITDIVLVGDSKLDVAGGTLKTKSASLFDSAVSDGSNFATQEKKSNISIALDAGIDLLDTGTCTFANYEALREKLGNGTTALANLSLSNALLKGNGTNDLNVGSGQNLSFGAISGFNTVNVTAGGTLTLGETQKDLSSVLGENKLTIEGVATFNLAGGKISTKRSTLVGGANFADSLAKTGVNILSQEVEIDFTDRVEGGVRVEAYNKVREALGVKGSAGTTSEALKNVSLSQSALVGSNDTFTADASVSFGAMQNFSSVALNGKELHIGSKDVDLESTVGDFNFTGVGSAVTFDGGKLRTSSSALFDGNYALKGAVTVTNSDFVLNLTDTDTKKLSGYNKIRKALSVEGSDYLKNVNLEAAALEADGDKTLNADANLTFKTVTGFDQIKIGAGNTLTLKEGTSEIENVVFTDDASKLKLVDGGITTNLSTFFKGEARDDVQFDSTLTKRNIEIENTANFVVTLKDAGECDIDQYNAIRNQLGSTLEASSALKHVNLINGTLAANERTTSFTTDADQLSFGAMTGFTDVTVATGHELHIGNAVSNLVSTIDNITVESGANVYLEGGVLNTNASAILTDSGVGQSLFAGASKKTGITVTSEALRLNFKDEGTALLSDYNAVRTALKAQSAESLLKAVSLENATLKADGEKTFTTDANLTFGAMSGFSKVTVAKDTTLHLGHETLNLVSTTENLEVNGELNIVGKANNGADMTVHVTSSLTGSGKITVGDPTGEGADIRVHSLSMTGGSLFIDPFYENAHSTMTIDELEGGLNSNLTVGNNALLVIGDTVANAQATLANLAAKTPSFSSNKAIAYVATPISISELGSIIINPSASSVDMNTDETTGAQTGSVTITHSDAGTAQFDAKSVYIADYAALVIDQARIGSSTVFTGASSIDFDDDGVLAIVNADEGTIDLGGETQTTGLRNVITDNPYYDGTVDENGNIVVEQNAAQGNLAVASTGIQAMTRRADFVLAQTVSNRSYEERDSDVSLWVDVGGEGYKASRMENGGSFKSDMGYGVFGADYAFGNGVLAGVAFQYGKGTVRGGFESIKNKVKNYAGTAYVAFGPGKAKFVLDAAYVKQDNSITSAKTAFNQSVDSEMFSVGASARAGFKVGNVELTPSVGVRVSKLKTDAMRSGNLKIAKQSLTLVQMPISLRMKTETLSEDGWTLEPSAKISFVPTFGDKELKILNREQTVLDTNPIQGDLGIALKKGNLKIDATFSYGSGSQGTSSIGGKVGLKYLF